MSDADERTDRRGDVPGWVTALPPWQHLAYVALNGVFVVAAGINTVVTHGGTRWLNALLTLVAATLFVLLVRWYVRRR